MRGTVVKLLDDRVSFMVLGVLHERGQPSVHLKHDTRELINLDRHRMVLVCVREREFFTCNWCT